MLRSTPLALELKDLQEGDILLLLPSVEVCKVQHVIKWLQAAFSVTNVDRHGHIDTTHASICTGLDSTEKPMLGHITETGWQKHPLVKYDTIGRAFLIFRMKDLANRVRLSQKAADEEANKNLRWNPFVAAMAFLWFVRLDPNREGGMESRPRSQYTICTKFVLECLKELARENGIKENIRSTATPKSLEAYLYADERFDMYIYLGLNAYESLKNEITPQLDKMNPCARIYFQNITYDLEHSSELNEMFKVLTLFEVMQPYLRSAGEDQSIAANLRKRGIFPGVVRNHRNFNLDEMLDKLAAERAARSPSGP